MRGYVSGVDGQRIKVLEKWLALFSNAAKPWNFFANLRTVGLQTERKPVNASPCT
jgi:hypothetical protein